MEETIASTAQAPIMLKPLLKIENLTKRFPGVLANDNVSLDVRRGEIHCLLGENGAGKSTLSETLYGTYAPDGGTIYFRGAPIEISSPRDAIKAGIGIVHQHFVLVPPLSVIENVILGTQTAGLHMDTKKARKRLTKLCESYDVALNLDAKVWHLSVGEQQWVEILKALYEGVDLLILDEPTAVLTPQASERLFSVLKQMKEGGLAIIFITHKLKEVMAVSDRVSVLRKGKLIATVNTADVSQQALANMMVGRDVVFTLQKEQAEIGGKVVEAEELRAKNERGDEVLHGVSFEIHQGEVLGLAGVSGNGQKELADVLVGVREPTGGRLKLSGKDMTKAQPGARIAAGVASIPQDRIREGLVMDFQVEENLVLGIHRQEPFARGSTLINHDAIRKFALEAMEQFDIATPSVTTVSKTLSGGNLQKLILARELSQKPTFLIANQPTRGLDVGATEYVRRRLLDQRQQGAAILLISEDLDEVINLSDRVAVIFKGEIMDILAAKEVTMEKLGLLMAGVKDA
jgi:general nucleoside transport system ATP-binding protein